MDVLLVVSLAFLILCVIGLCFKNTNRTCKTKKRLDGRTCIVTGGTSGIGLEVAKDLAMRGARLIVACPFVAEGEAAKKTIVSESGNEEVAYKFLDLSSFDSVRKFAADIIQNEERLDILMNNAGVGLLNKVTGDGFSITMQVNYLGHFLLTILLLPLLKKSGTPSEPSRIVNTSSILHRYPFFKVNDIHDKSKAYFQPIINYCHSKLCLLLLSRELTKKLTNSNVVINDATPGEVGTRIILTGGSILGTATFYLFYYFSKTPYEGAQNLLHVALDDAAGKASGKYYRNCQLCGASSLALDDRLARSLWDESVASVKLNKEECGEHLK